MHFVCYIARRLWCVYARSCICLSNARYIPSIVTISSDVLSAVFYNAIVHFESGTRFA